MKVGIVSSAIAQDLNGIGNYIYNLIREFNEINSNNTSFYLINSHRNIYSSNYEIIINNPFPVLKTYSWYPFMALKLRSRSLDIIHNPSQVPTFFKLKQKYVITVHDLTPFLTPSESKIGRPLVYKLLFSKTIKSADKIITDSNSTKRDLMSYFSVPEKKIKVILLAADKKFKPLDDEELTRVRQRHNLNFPFILYVGTLESRKNIPALIKAFYKFKKMGLPYKLVIGGKKGWKYKDIFETIDKLNLQKDVLFTGYVLGEDLPALYNAADLLVYPSIYEGFGLPPLEAMACGTPVITSNTSSLPEVVGDAGIMVDPYDVEGLADAIHEVLTNDGLREDMIKKGLERAKMFSWERCARETIKVYEEIYNK